VICSFHWKGLWFPLLNLFLGISFFEAIVNGIVSRISISACVLLVLRKTTHFCTLIFYPATLPKVFDFSEFFVVVFRVFHRIISSANRDSLTSSFRIWIPFSSCSCLIALARNSKTILNKSGESGYTCLIPDFSKNGFNCSPFGMMLAVGLSYPLLCWGTFLLFLVGPQICLGLSWHI
jgi:hypothetical protein